MTPVSISARGPAGKVSCIWAVNKSLAVLPSQRSGYSYAAVAYVEIVWECLVDRFQEASEFASAMKGIAFSDDILACRIQCGEQGRRSNLIVVSSGALAKKGSRMQCGLGPFSRCICEYSSTQSTAARCGGSRYDPTMPRTWSMNWG
jgi:hypothetical protein